MDRGPDRRGSRDRRVREYLSGARGVPGWIATEINDLLAQFPDGVHNVDPRKFIAILQSAMERSGWTAGQAAASIFGVAIANASRHVDRDEIRDWVKECTD